MLVRVSYQYHENGTVTADVSGDIEEFRDLLERLGIMKMAAPERRDGAATGFHALRSLCSAMEEQLPVALETRSAASRVSVRDRRPLDRHARMAEYAAEIAAENRKADEVFLEFLRSGKDFVPEEFRSQAVGSGAAGGFITPQSFADRFTQSLKQYDQLFDVATLLETDTGTGCNFPMDDDTSAVATIVLENAPSLITSPVMFDSVTFGRCPMWRSGLVNASTELVSDSAFDLAGLLAKSFARRFARGVGAAFVTQLLADADVAVTSASPTVVTPDELLSLMGALDASYAMRGVFLMSFASYIARSASRSSPLRVRPSAVARLLVAMPTLALRKNSWFSTVNGSRNAARSRSARRTASLVCARSSRMANSSPPMRATVSPGRKQPCKRRAAVPRSLSPAA